MSARLSPRLPLPPLSSSSRIDANLHEVEKPGIVTVLGSDPRTAKAPSLRRTLSTDMSSRKFLVQNGFSLGSHPLKKTASSVSIEDSSASSSDDEEDNTLKKDVEGCGGQVYLWKSMKERGADLEKPSETWSSILFQKVEDSKSLPPPYVHPLLKRSKSCLSTRSLEICTESLGSETGSDGFSSYPASEVEDSDAEDFGLSSRAAAFDLDEFYMAKYNYATAARKGMRTRSFPPPIQSLSQGNGGSVSMQSRRDNGRFVLEAVSVLSERNFEARRVEGRLVLTFAGNNESYPDDDEDMEEEEEEEKDEWEMELNDDISNKEEEETEENDEDGVDAEFVSERVPKLLSRGVMNVHKLSKMLSKPIATRNRNPAWQSEYGGAFNYREDEPILLEQSLPLKSPVVRILSTPQLVPSTGTAPDRAFNYREDKPILLEQSLPPESPVAWMLSTPQLVPSTGTAPASLNDYEYFWRKKAPTNTFIASIAQPLSTLKGYRLNISTYGKNQQSDKAHGYLAPLLQSCNGPSRTDLWWEPECIATS